MSKAFRFVDLTNFSRLVFTGRDRQSFLQGMVTNDIGSLPAGRGCYAFHLSATGQILFDLRLTVEADRIWALLEPGRAEFAMATLDHYLVMERCKIVNVSDETAQVFVFDEGSAEWLWQVSGIKPEKWSEGDNLRFSLADLDILAVRSVRVGVFGADLIVAQADRDALLKKLHAIRNSRLMDETALDSWRIVAGIPRDGIDFEAKTLAPETSQGARAIHYRKGCYVGQEIVARIDARGHTNRGLCRFLLADDAPLPEPSTPVLVDGAIVGRVTSATVSSLGDNRKIALGYIRHEHGAPGTVVGIDGGSATVLTLSPVLGSEESEI